MIPRAEMYRMVDRVAAERRLPRSAITGPHRTTDLVIARRIIAQRLRELKVPYPEIGKVIGRNPSTAIYLVKGRPRL
jgi:chromosomal replication initiation ATPase DnaA